MDLPVGICKIKTLPDEILSNVFQTITDKADLINLMVSYKRFARVTEQALWRVCNIKGYTKLLEMDSEKQDRFACWIRNFSIVFEHNSHRPVNLVPYLPQFRELIIGHHSRAFENMKIATSKLITPCLTRLEVHTGKTDDFLPALSQVKGLKHLIISDHVETDGGKLDELVRLVADTPSLVTLHAGELSSDEVFVEVTTSEAMEDLTVTVHIAVSSVLQALETRSALANLCRLRLTTQARAVSILLPKLPCVESLELTISGVLTPGQTSTFAAVDVFHAVGTISKLKELTLAIRLSQVRATVGMFNPLKNLVWLSKLNLVHNIEPNHHISNTSVT
jgi:D-aminopeptidase